MSFFQSLAQITKLHMTGKSSSQKDLEKTQARTKAMEDSQDKISELFEAADETILKRIAKLKDFIEKYESLALSQLEDIRSAHTKKISLAESIFLRRIQDARTGTTLALTRLEPHKSHVPLSNHYILRMLETASEATHFNLNMPTVKCDALKNLAAIGSEPPVAPLISRGFFTITRDLKTIELKRSVGGKDLDLSNPAGVAVNPKTKQIYIADNSNARIVILNENMEFVADLGSGRKIPYRFSEVSDVAVSVGGEYVAVADRGGNQIHLFDADMNRIHAFRCNSEEEERGGGGPFSLCFDNNDHIFVSHCSLSLILKYDVTGKLLCSFGGSGSDNPVSNCHGIVANELGEVFVLARPSDHIKVFSTEGLFLRQIDIEKTADNWNFLERGPNEGIVVSDCSGNKVLFYDRDGKRLQTIDYVLPSGIAFGPDGRFFMISCRDCNISEY
eukprot:TRINITY_DN1074_c0_g1_i3.p1 TRINITY_DN1074_c0_g1~~TRINITY_DN1074_c0_g1_i3.p1  ORF type:complete len:446 (-),score=64.55 TRINITY_DN1074_c0_g1_i3:386-1723(-)